MSTRILVRNWFNLRSKWNQFIYNLIIEKKRLILLSSCITFTSINLQPRCNSKLSPRNVEMKLTFLGTPNSGCCGVSLSPCICDSRCICCSCCFCCCLACSRRSRSIRSFSSILQCKKKINWLARKSLRSWMENWRIGISREEVHNQHGKQFDLSFTHSQARLSIAMRSDTHWTQDDEMWAKNAVI